MTCSPAIPGNRPVSIVVSPPAGNKNDGPSNERSGQVVHVRRKAANRAEEAISVFGRQTELWALTRATREI